VHHIEVCDGDRVARRAAIFLKSIGGDSVVQLYFDVEQWKTMSPAEQVKRCIVLAEEAQKLANVADERLAALYLEIAVRWLLLAEAIDTASCGHLRVC
jgi:hypothetical protein